jgi:hypothetical protein
MLPSSMPAALKPGESWSPCWRCKGFMLLSTETAHSGASKDVEACICSPWSGQQPCNVTPRPLCATGAPRGEDGKVSELPSSTHQAECGALLSTRVESSCQKVEGGTRRVVHHVVGISTLEPCGSAVSTWANDIHGGFLWILVDGWTSCHDGWRVCVIL